MKSIQCRMARAALEWSTQDLAREARVGVNTVNRFEAGQDARMSSVDKLRAALQAGGVIFLEENGEGPGVRIRARTGVAPSLAPTGPATEIVRMMDAAIEAHESSIPIEDLNSSNDE